VKKVDNCSWRSGEKRGWLLNVAYDGTRYHGWQIQANDLTVQGELTWRVRAMFRNNGLSLIGTSRTDAGVHALDQQVSFVAVTPDDMNAERIRVALNRWLAADIKVLDVREVGSDFHAQYDSCGKSYVYCLHVGERCNPLHVRYVWHLPLGLDLELMRRSAEGLVGRRDFASFASKSSNIPHSTVRTINRLEIVERGDFIFFHVAGDGFLYKMVRNIVGYLVSVGCGRARNGDVAKVLVATNRSVAENAAPARGLFLCKVFWGKNDWQDYYPQYPPFAFDF